MITRAAIALALACTACGQSFEPASLVNKLRLLAVRSEPAELRPGDAATLEALVADPRGAGREVTLTWARCDPPDLVPNLLSCIEPANVTPLGTGPTVTVRAPEDFLRTGPAGPVEERPMFVLLVVQAGDERVLGFKEIEVTSRAVPLNQNPRLTGLKAIPAGETAEVREVARGARVRLVADFDPASRERFSEGAMDRTEELMFSWFATAGSMDRNRTFGEPENEWTAPAIPQTVQVWVVLRDRRNGTDWRTTTVEVR